MIEKRLYTIAELAKLMKSGQKTINRAISRGDIKIVKIGRLVRIPTEEVKKLTSESKILTSEEAAKMLNLSPLGIRNLVKSGQINAVRLSPQKGRLRIPLEEIEKYLESLKKDSNK